MEFDLITISVCGAIAWVGFWLVGIFSLWMGDRCARSEYRVKGYLRSPSGKQWFPFLLEKRYEAFENPSIPFFFKISHFCLNAMMLILAAVLVLVGTTVLLKNMGGP
jgi:hypothetical protein